ncbi:RNA exonuclease 3 [Penicillium verhagenii]|uniref:RNA exonuclease 3 n=1 Tax=Penicillium verhagenii TaxID=1562060 RepID=UPI002545B5DC|nr:RNA exonuclease 3 [Penicillium verhagenii]XP_057019082.1 RNA exonuclease 3 [Penicillium verhagenii]KAJ5918406.1 RNA exonuclease 3 [Penicillium verhagenii]KAJ5924875.1 RNA exonuclease 3 [Penicillium verhagenii]
MFTTLGLFNGVPCPQVNQCCLITCIFSHTAQTSTLPIVVKRASSSVDDERTTKRLKVDSATSSSGSKSISSIHVPVREHSRHPPVAVTEADQKSQSVKPDISRLSSVSRKVSPPPGRTASKTTSQEQKAPATSQPSTSSQLPPRKVPKESLNPRMLPKAPATHAVRSAILTKLHSGMSALNEKLAKDKGSSNKCFVLNKDELVTMALDEEEKVAKDNPGVYSNIIKLRIVKLTKMGLEEWAQEVMAHLNSRYYKIQPVQPNTQKLLKPITTGLSMKEETALAVALVTPVTGLEEFGYVTKAPTQTEVETAKRGVIESKGWEKCDRCGGRFQVFPGRREDGALASGGQCTYHPSRPMYSTRKKTDNVTGSQEAYFPCCTEPVGASSGCTKAKTHVFKVSEVKRLASILQFEETPAQPNKGPLDPVSFDCEMGYTTLGLELIRLTAVTWPQGRDILDILVKPMGEVLDLNSRYSGVFPEHFASAIPYGTANAKQENNGKDTKPLEVVDSPAAARSLLFTFLQPDTPLIGHAIDNDLNVCRIIHPVIIDTVILYPHPRGRLPSRMSLKALAQKVLDRNIQMGGDQGHDSKEDSIATGDLVRVKAGVVWKRLEAKGWKFQNNNLVAPPGQKVQDVREAAQGGGGPKRNNPGTT